MSLSAALGAATSGLAVTARATEVASDNIANALTPGFARREIALAARALGGVGTGVAVESVARATDARATAARRAADAESGSGDVLAAAEARLAAAFGAPDDPGALPARITALETALARAADTPESAALQTAVLGAARDLAGALNRAAGETRALREEADATVARLAADLDSTLQRIVRLNREIVAAGPDSRDLPGLLEARDREVDRVSALVPVRVAARDGGAVALYTPGGAVLLDGRAARVGFAPATVITADMTLASGALSPLTLDGDPVAAGAEGGPLGGGRLGAWMTVRDSTAPAADVQLDAVAAELIERLSDPAVDPTLAPGDPGLFTDAGGPLAALYVPGLAARVAVNAAVDPAQGGAVWRLRDGIGAAAPGPVGEDDTLRAMIAALDDRAAAPADTGLAGSFGLAGLAGGVAGLRLQAEARAEEAAAYAAGRQRRLAEAESAALGVSSDDELARLLRLEQAYAANARVVATVDAMLQTLMEI